MAAVDESRRLRMLVGEGSSAPAPTPAGESLEVSVVERCLEGDRGAARVLMRYVAPYVARSVRGVLGSSDPEVEDVVQDSLLAIMRALETFRGDASLRWFSTRIASRVAVSTLRTRIRRRRLDRQVLASHAVAQAASSEASQRMLLVREVLPTLKREQAETIVLRWILGHSLSEVAAITGVPTNTVRSRTRLARKALAEGLRQHPSWRHVCGPEQGEQQ